MRNTIFKIIYIKEKFYVKFIIYHEAKIKKKKKKNRFLTPNIFLENIKNCMKVKALNLYIYILIPIPIYVYDSISLF